MGDWFLPLQGGRPQQTGANTVFLLLPTASLAGAQAKDEEKRKERLAITRSESLSTNREGA